ncbi:MAG: hypothetical protein R3240_10990, partial [Gammaproteobacteria bacterium]|nr:hypothetical protein [Gammaproteobacteria bacterium]
YFTGRTLSHTALIAEQVGRNGRQALTGQGFSRGVVTGLDVKKSQDSKYFLISPGAGMVMTGEDVLVPRSLQIDFRDIHVYAPVDMLSGLGDTTSTSTDTLLARKLGPTLGELISNEIEILPAGILVLQAVTSDIKGIGESRDPCEEDISNDAFENWQTADGFRLVYYVWPTDYLSLPSQNIPETDITELDWQNRIAYQIFEKEKTVTYHPWDEFGLAIALAGFDEEWNIQFVDVDAVARQGGKPRYHSLVENDFGTPFMWQARTQQFNAQLTELTYQYSLSQSFSDETERQNYFRNSIQAISEYFRHLPPVGLLPKQALNFDNWQNYFFPSDYQVELVAVPMEQLDIVLEAAAPLEPFHIAQGDRVRIAVPVPQVWYEPRLLKTEEANQLFQQTVNRFSKNRALLLDQRLEVREKLSCLNKALTTEEKTFPTPDPDALEGNESDWRFLVTQTPDTDWPEEDYDDDDWQLSVPTIESTDQMVLCRKRIDIEDLQKFYADLAVQVDANYDIYINGIHAILNAGPSPEESLTSLVFPDQLLNNFHTGENIIAVRMYNFNSTDSAIQIRMAWQYLEDSFGTSGTTPYRSKSLDDFTSWLQTTQLATSLMDTTDLESFEIINQLLSSINDVGFNQYITDLQAMVDSADDTINLKFLKIQTDIYRLRQLMLGNDDSSRL